MATSIERMGESGSRRRKKARGSLKKAKKVKEKEQEVQVTFQSPGRRERWLDRRKKHTEEKDGPPTEKEEGEGK